MRSWTIGGTAGMTNLGGVRGEGGGGELHINGCGNSNNTWWEGLLRFCT